MKNKSHNTPLRQTIFTYSSKPTWTAKYHYHWQSHKQMRFVSIYCHLRKSRDFLMYQSHNKWSNQPSIIVKSDKQKHILCPSNPTKHLYQLQTFNFINLFNKIKHKYLKSMPPITSITRDHIAWQIWHWTCIAASVSIPQLLSFTNTSRVNWQ